LEEKFIREILLFVVDKNSQNFKKKSLLNEIAQMRNVVSEIEVWGYLTLLFFFHHFE